MSAAHCAADIALPNLILGSPSFQLPIATDAMQNKKSAVRPVYDGRSPTCFEAVSVLRVSPCAVSPQVIPIGLDISRLCTLDLSRCNH